MEIVQHRSKQRHEAVGLRTKRVAPTRPISFKRSRTLFSVESARCSPRRRFSRPFVSLGYWRRASHAGQRPPRSRGREGNRQICHRAERRTGAPAIMSFKCGNQFGRLRTLIWPNFRWKTSVKSGASCGPVGIEKMLPAWPRTA